MEFTRVQLDTVDSTNTYAKLHANEFSKDTITCITAEEQTAGRGRLGRKWSSPRGVNLYISLFFCLQAKLKNLACLGHLGIHSLIHVLSAKNIASLIKWPNDVLLNGKKLAGVLCELSTVGSIVEVVLGIGLNVNMPTNLLEKIDQPATSLLAESGHQWDREELLAHFQRQFVKDLGLFKKEGFAPFAPTFNERLAFKGKQVRVLEGTQEWTGICRSVTTDGELHLELSENRFHNCSSGILSYTPFGK